MSKRSRTQAQKDALTSKWILAQRVTAAEVLEAVDLAIAGYPGLGLGELRSAQHPSTRFAMVEDVLALLARHDRMAVLIRIESMIIHGALVGGGRCGAVCEAGGGQCCAVGRPT